MNRLKRTYKKERKKKKKKEKPLPAFQGSNFQVLFFHGMTTAGILSFSNYQVQQRSCRKLEQIFETSCRSVHPNTLHILGFMLLCNVLNPRS